MQTFLPYLNYVKSAMTLDRQRLGKQRSEAWQIYKTLKQGPTCNYKIVYGRKKAIYGKVNKKISTMKTPWYNHPVVRMWDGYEKNLLFYGLTMCLEWIDRGYKDNMKEKFIQEIRKALGSISQPNWLTPDFCKSHRKILLGKNPKYYRQKGF